MKKQILRLVLFLTLLFSGLGVLSASAATIPSGAGKFNGHYYYVYPNGTCSSYSAAAAYCKSLGGHLATITSDSENQYVYNYSKSLK